MPALGVMNKKKQQNTSFFMLVHLLFFRFFNRKLLYTGNSSMNAEVERHCKCCLTQVNRKALCFSFTRSLWKN